MLAIHCVIIGHEAQALHGALEARPAHMGIAAGRDIDRADLMYVCQSRKGGAGAKRGGQEGKDEARMELLQRLPAPKAENGRVR